MKKKAKRRALTGPPSDRMMRSGDLVEVAECEMCKVILKKDTVASHYEKTGHETYNRKLVSRNEYNTRIGGQVS
jgi:hypothetical protein